MPTGGSAGDASHSWHPVFRTQAHSLEENINQVDRSNNGGCGLGENTWRSDLGGWGGIITHKERAVTLPGQRKEQKVKLEGGEEM